MTRARRGLVVVAAFAVAVALRMGPLWQSPLPFNPDGILYAGIAHDTLARGRLPLARLPVDSLGFASFLTIAAAVTGVRPLVIAQPVVAIAAATVVPLAAAVTRRLAAERGWPTRRATVATATAAGLLAVEGLYLHRSMPVDEQSLGLVLVPLVALTVARATTGDWRFGVVAGVALLFLLPLHNLDSVVAGLLLVGWLVLCHARDIGSRRTRRRLAGGTIGYLGLLVGYYTVVPQVTPAIVVQSERLLQLPGLLLAWTVFVIALGSWLVGRGDRTQRLVVGVGFGSLFVILAVNAVQPVFPGTPATNPLLLALLAPLMVPAAFAAWGVPDARTTRPALSLVALATAPAVLIGVSLTAALTPEYVNLAYRASTFLHFPALVLAGAGVAGITAHVDVERRRVVTGGAVALVLVAAAMSLPVAFAGLDMLAYKGVTTSGELAATEFTTHHVPGTWATDDHLRRIATYWTFGPTPVPSSATVEPVYAWTHGGGPPDCPTLTQRSWTTVGAQFFPAPPATVSSEALAAFQARHDVVYAGGAGDAIYLVRPAGACG